MQTRRSQIQAIADHLAGPVDNSRQSHLLEFEEPWRSIYRAIRAAPAGQGREALRAVLAGRPDQDAIIGAILAAVPGASLVFPSLREIADKLPPIRWVWTGWVPLGMITLVGAVPGAGKSYFAMDLARRIIAGEPFPDGTPQPPWGGDGAGSCVIYVDAESVPQILKERAQLWKMDTSRLYLMRPEGKLYIDFGDPADRDHLVEMALHLKPALIIIDSLGSISSKGENNVEDVRDLLSFLNQLALDAQCGLLLVHHLRKRGALPLMDVLTVDDFRGSSHIIAMSRSVLGLSVVQTGPKQDRNGPRRLEVVKSNLARYPEPLGMVLKPLHPQGAWIEYTTEAPQPYQESKQVDQCAEWLLTVLEDGPAKPQNLEEEAKKRGFSRATLYRAHDMLGDRVANTTGRQNPKNEWCLAEENDESV